MTSAVSRHALRSSRPVLCASWLVAYRCFCIFTLFSCSCHPLAWTPVAHYGTLFPIAHSFLRGSLWLSLFCWAFLAFPTVCLSRAWSLVGSPFRPGIPTPVPGLSWGGAPIFHSHPVFCLRHSIFVFPSPPSVPPFLTFWVFSCISSCLPHLPLPCFPASPPCVCVFAPPSLLLLLAPPVSLCPRGGFSGRSRSPCLRPSGPSCSLRTRLSTSASLFVRFASLRFSVPPALRTRLGRPALPSAGAPFACGFGLFSLLLPVFPVAVWVTVGLLPLPPFLARSLLPSMTIALLRVPPSPFIRSLVASPAPASCAPVAFTGRLLAVALTGGIGCAVFLCHSGVGALFAQPLRGSPRASACAAPSFPRFRRSFLPATRGLAPAASPSSWTAVARCFPPSFPPAFGSFTTVQPAVCMLSIPRRVPALLHPSHCSFAFPPTLGFGMPQLSVAPEAVPTPLGSSGPRDHLPNPSHRLQLPTPPTAASSPLGAHPLALTSSRRVHFGLLVPLC